MKCFTDFGTVLIRYEKIFVQKKFFFFLLLFKILPIRYGPNGIENN